MKLKLLIGALALTTFSQAALAQSDDKTERAGLFIEPSLTYLSGDMNVNYPPILGFNDSNEKTQGLGLGLRLGMHVFDTFFIAADGRYAKPEYKSQAFNASAPSDLSNLGLTVGLQTPLAGVRVWGTYLVSGALDPQEVSGYDLKFNNPKGYRVGAGLYVAMVSVNLEYQDVKYESVTGEKFGFTGTFESVKGNDKSYILSVSMPIAI